MIRPATLVVLAALTTAGAATGLDRICPKSLHHSPRAARGTSGRTIGPPSPASSWAASQSAPAASDGWITHPAARGDAAPIVLHFRREVSLGAVPRHYLARVTADNRFILYVNGRRVAAGPSTGDTQHWRYATLDLAAYLRRGANIVAAVVWNGVKSPVIPAQAAGPAPLFQQSLAPGLRLEGIGCAAQISTKNPGWQVRRDAGHRLTSAYGQFPGRYYVAGAPEVIDAATADWNWDQPGPRDGWFDAVAAPAAMRKLVPDRLPAQRYAPVANGAAVATDIHGGNPFPARAFTVPAYTATKLLIRRDAMVSAYLALTVAGGAGATIKVTYAEALTDGRGKRGDRAAILFHKINGLTDTFLPDGPRRTFAPLWWRTWRYLQIALLTRAQPLRLETLTTTATGYPFETIGQFHSSDPELDRIWQIGWRTAQIDAHETFMDSAYWEQLQYVGDTRIEAQIAYAVAGDARLAEQAIDAFAQSDVAGGLIEGAYPSRGSNPMPMFAPLWIGLLHDWWLQQPDIAVVARNVPRMRRVLAWFGPGLGPNGLLTRNPQWNFIDWAGQRADDRNVFPSFSRSGESCLMSALYLGALHQASQLEASLGSASHAHHDDIAARALTGAIRRHCWSARRRLFADNPDGTAFSQQMNALAVLYDVAPRDEARAILDRITTPGKGIAAPPGMFSSSLYFSWYLARAFDHAGLANRYTGLLQTWRRLLPLHFTTWPETMIGTRSDTHGWSGHPTADLLGIVAGIAPDRPGYRAVRVAPHLGSLTALDATAATPSGPVRVRYRRVGGTLFADIDRPAALPGTFIWRRHRYPLVQLHSHLELGAGQE